MFLIAFGHSLMSLFLFLWLTGQVRIHGHMCGWEGMWSAIHFRQGHCPIPLSFLPFPNIDMKNLT
jgi:hypothetical protein